jgi:hypothetical protein
MPDPLTPTQQRILHALAGVWPCALPIPSLGHNEDVAGLREDGLIEYAGITGCYVITEAGITLITARAKQQVAEVLKADEERRDP